MLRVDVVDHGERHKHGSRRCEIGKHVVFDTSRLESYFFREWSPVLFDTLLVAAAVEFADRTQKRPQAGWSRDFELRIPVSDPELWSQPEVKTALRAALNLLTGDSWLFSFRARSKPDCQPRQGVCNLQNDAEAVIPFSDGLDSRAVAGLMALRFGHRLVRVRLGQSRVPSAGRHYQPFTSVPYRVRNDAKQFRETSVRSRGFKFSVLAGMAALLAGASTVLIPESGQGALGPMLVPVGPAYVDYRNSPLFSVRMERFFRALTGNSPKFEFPRLWHTKGETLKSFTQQCEDGETWVSTRSCWQQSRQVGIGGKLPQCGVCAACMLRRMSVHSAGLAEPADTYIWQTLRESSFEAGACPSFNKLTRAMKEYAIGGVLHLDHLANLVGSGSNDEELSLVAHQLSQALKISPRITKSRTLRLLGRHQDEWSDFVDSLGADSFVSNWTASPR